MMTTAPCSRLALADRAKHCAPCGASLEPCEETSVPPDCEDSRGRDAGAIRNLAQRRGCGWAAFTQPLGGLYTSPAGHATVMSSVASGNSPLIHGINAAHSD